jgi:curved DNA-binding protein CbpA
MTILITWYDVLGVPPDATPDGIREAWQARKAALQPGTLAGAPPNVLSAADRALRAVEEAWRVLADPAAWESYDEDIGFRRPGGGPTLGYSHLVGSLAGVFEAAGYQLTAPGWPGWAVVDGRAWPPRGALGGCRPPVHSIPPPDGARIITWRRRP